MRGLVVRFNHKSNLYMHTPSWNERNVPNHGTLRQTVCSVWKPLIATEPQQ